MEFLKQTILDGNNPRDIQREQELEQVIYKFKGKKYTPQEIKENRLKFKSLRLHSNLPEIFTKEKQNKAYQISSVKSTSVEDVFHGLEAIVLGELFKIISSETQIIKTRDISNLQKNEELVLLALRFQEKIETHRLETYRTLIEQIDTAPCPRDTKKNIINKLSIGCQENKTFTTNSLVQPITPNEIDPHNLSFIYQNFMINLREQIPNINTEYTLLHNILKKIISFRHKTQNISKLEEEIQGYFKDHNEETAKKLSGLHMQYFDSIQNQMEQSSSQNKVLKVEINGSQVFSKIDLQSKNNPQAYFLSLTHEDILLTEPVEDQVEKVNPLKILFPKIHLHENLETQLNKNLSLLSTIHVEENMKEIETNPNYFSSYQEYNKLKYKFLKTYEKRHRFKGNIIQILPEIFNQLLPLIIFEHTQKNTSQNKEIFLKREPYKSFEEVEKRILSNNSRFDIEDSKYGLKKYKKFVEQLEDEYQNTSEILINGDVFRKNIILSNNSTYPCSNRQHQIRKNIGSQFIDPGGVLGDIHLDVRRFSPYLPDQMIIDAHNIAQEVLGEYYLFDPTIKKSFISDLKKSYFTATFRAASAYQSYELHNEAQHYFRESTHLLKK